jgi:multiple sugar transport system substrate-binding protein
MFGPSSDWMYQGIILSAGGTTISDDHKTLMFGEGKALDAIRMLRGMADAGAMQDLALDQQTETFASGNAGMYLQTSALQSALISGSTGKFELRDAAMPSFGDMATRPTNSGSALVIFSNDPLKQRAAWELMKFLTSKRGYTIITSQIGYLPLRTDIVDDPQYLGPWVKDHPLVRPNLDQLDRLSPWVSFPGQNYHQIEKTLTDAVEQAVFGKDDAAKVMTDAEHQAQQLMPH